MLPLLIRRFVMAIAVTSPQAAGSGLRSGKLRRRKTSLLIFDRQ
jgi:hypothetical protein